MVWALDNVNAGARYEISARWQAKDSRASDATYTINTGEQSQSVQVNQKRVPPGWYSLGIYTLNPGDSIELAPSKTGKVVTGDIKLTPLSGNRAMPITVAGEGKSAYIFEASNGNKIGDWSDGYKGEYRWFSHNPTTDESADEFYWNLGATGLSGKYLISTRWKTSNHDVNSRSKVANYLVEADADSDTARRFSCIPSEAGDITVEGNSGGLATTVSEDVQIEGGESEITPEWKINVGDKLYAIQVTSPNQRWVLPFEFSVYGTYMFAKDFRGVIHQALMMDSGLDFAEKNVPPANCGKEIVYPNANCGFLSPCTINVCGYEASNGNFLRAQARVWHSQVSCPAGKILLAELTSYFNDAAQICVDPYCNRGAVFDYSQGKCVAKSAPFAKLIESYSEPDSEKVQDILNGFINLNLK